MPRKGEIPPQFLAHPPRSWKKDMPKVRREARSDIRKYGGKMPRRRSRRTYSYSTRSRKHTEKIGAVPALVEVGGLVAGGSEALSGNVTGGIAVVAVSQLLAWGLKKLGRHSMLHKLGVKVGRKKELTVM